MPRRRAPLDVLTLNRGDHAKYDAIARAIAGHRAPFVDVQEPSRHALAALQEMHNQQRTLDRLVDAGYGVWRGNLEDSEANPVVWDPEQFAVKEKYSFPLLPAGRRSGTYNMAKSLNLVVGRHLASQRRVAFGSAHNLHRQWMRGRGGAARDFSENLVDHAEEFGCARIIGCDWNAKAKADSLAPVRRAPGWHLDQLRAPVTTHGRGWSPDGFAYTDSEEEHVLIYVDHRAIHVPGTDHRGNSARFLLTVKELR